MPGQLTKFLLAGAALTLGAGAFGIFLAKNAPPVRHPAALATATPAEESYPVELEFRPEPGQRYVYSFTRKIDIRGLGSQMPKVEYRGTLSLDVLSADAKEISALAQAKVEGYTGREPPLLRLTLDPSGKRIALRTEAVSDDESAQYLSVAKDLIALWDFPSATDTLGQFESRIESLPSAPGSLLQKKTKLKYLTQSDTEILRSIHWLRWDKALALPAELKGEEHTRLGRIGATLETATSYHLRFVEKKRSIPLAASRLAKLTRDDSLLLSAAKATDNPEYRRVSWAELSLKLKQLSGMKPNERLAVFGDLVRFLRREPASLSVALASLGAADIRAGADSILFKTIVGALASAGSPEAQSALLALYRNPECGISGKGIILTAFTTTQANPTAETLNFLRREVSRQADADLKFGAAYALGSGLQSAGDTGGLGALADLWHQSLQSGSLNAQLSALDAIGNSGRVEFLPLLAEAMAESNPVAVQAKATFALRFIAAPEARTSLAEKLTNRQDQIRAAAAGALVIAPWSEQFRAALLGCSQHEADPEIQKSCEETLAAHPLVAGN